MQATLETESEGAANTIIQLVWAIHALIDSNKANQLSLQAAGGIQLVIHLLAQASPVPPSQALLPPSAHPSPTPTVSMGFSQLVTDQLQLQSQLQLDSSSQLDTKMLREEHTQQPHLATALVWLMGSAAADVPANQSALHQAGAVQLLVHQMQWSGIPGVVQGSMWALGNLAKGCVDIQTEVELQVRLHSPSA